MEHNGHVIASLNYGNIEHVIWRGQDVRIWIIKLIQQKHNDNICCYEKFESWNWSWKWYNDMIWWNVMAKLNVIYQQDNDNFW